MPFPSESDRSVDRHHSAWEIAVSRCRGSPRPGRGADGYTPAMRIVVAPQGFNGTLTGPEAAEAIALHRVVGTPIFVSS